MIKKKKKTSAKGTAVILRTKMQQRKRKDENLVKGRSGKIKRDSKALEIL